ncbi:MAG: InlB B-repeat-containing protein, partial [Bacteroidales bacterium]|nr:InlB B-repeat-containing protein [Bacteroidales bacterium]
YNPILSIDTVSPLQVAHHGSQGITLNVPYTFYSGTQDPVNPNAQNELRLYISDENGSFDNKKLLKTVNVNGGDNIKHQGHIAITLPANTVDSDKYKIQIEASNYPLQSNIVELNIYKQWYLTINGTEYGTVNAVEKQLCRDSSRQIARATVNNEACRFLYWEEGGKPVEGAGAEYSFLITKDRTLTAVFDTVFTLRFASPLVGATAYFANNNLTEITLLNGDTAKIRAYIDEGYVFKGFRLGTRTWNLSQPVLDYAVARGGTVEVLTDSIPYEYEFSVYPHAKLGTASGSGTYKHFSTVVAVATPKEPKAYSRFLHWEDMDGQVVGTDSVLRIENIHQGGSYRAVFEETFHHVNLSVSDPLDGYTLQCSQRKADSTYSAFDLTTIGLRAVPGRGIEFRHWEVTKNGLSNGIIEDNPYYLTQNSHLDADYAFKAIFDTLTYTLEVSAQNGYAVGTGIYMYGKSVVLRATPNKGYHFAQWQSGSQVLGTADTLLVRIMHDSVIKAVCEPNRYAVKIISNNAQLGSVDMPSGLYAYGSTLTLNALPASGAEFRYWVIDGDTLGTATPYILRVEDSCQVLAIFSHARSHVSLYASNSLYGQVHGAGIYEWHSPVEIVAEAFPGYKFEGWRTQQGETILQNPIHIAQIEGDTAFTALFSPQTFQVKVQANAEGDVWVGNPADQLQERQVEYMDYVQIQAVPHSGYEFAGWYDAAGNLCSTYPQEGFSAARDTVLTARFELVRYSVSLFVKPLEAGVLKGSGRYTADALVNVSVDTSEGYNFLGWYEADTLFEKASKFSIKLTSDRYFVARFKENRYEIKVKANDPAKVDSLYGAGEYQYAYNANVYAYAAKGYEVACWLNKEGDTVSRQNPYLHDVEGAETLTAVMRPAKLKAKFRIEPEDAGRVRCGEVFYDEPASATAQASYGYTFSHWENTEGVRVGNASSLVFTARTDTTLVAVFDSVEFLITGVAQNPLRGEVSGSGSYKYLSTCTLSISHDLRYDFAGWHDQEGRMLSLQHTWTFTVTEPLQVTAYFEPLPVLTNLSVYPENSGMIRYRDGQMQGEVKVLYEDSLRLQAVPAKGMKFAKWMRVDVTGLEEEWDDENNVFFPQGGSSLTAVFDTMTYPVSLSVEPAEAGKVQGGGEYKYGSFISLRAEADTHYRFYAYMAGDEVLSYDSAYVLQVDSAMEIRAVFQPQSYWIYALADLREGDVEGTGKYPYGSIVTLVAFAWNDSVEFDYWSHDWDGSDTVSFDACMQYQVMKDYEILFPFFKPASRLLQVETEGKGYVKGAGSYENGNTAELVAEAAPGYHFTVWKEYGMEIGREAEISLAMRQNRDIVAVFEPDTFHVRLASRIEDVEVFGAGGYVNGSRVNIWTGGTPAGYRFVAWKNEAGETVSDAQGFVLPLTCDTALYAEWQEVQYKIDLQAEGEGEVSGSGEYGFDTTALLVATPAEGYRLQAWYHGNKLFSEHDTLLWASVSDLALTAVFEKIVIPASPILNRAEGGEILVAEESENSATVSLQAAPKENFHFAYWSVGDSVVGMQQQMEVTRETASRTVAHFMPDVYYVTLRSSTPEGLSALSGSGSFHKGESVKLKATVRSKHEFIGWFEEGSDTPISVQAEDTLTVTRPMKLDARTRRMAK